jgi:hypothetical protein
MICVPAVELSNADIFLENVPAMQTVGVKDKWEGMWSLLCEWCVGRGRVYVVLLVLYCPNLALIEPQIV